MLRDIWGSQWTEELSIRTVAIAFAVAILPVAQALRPAIALAAFDLLQQDSMVAEAILGLPGEPVAQVVVVERSPDVIRLVGDHV